MIKCNSLHILYASRKTSRSLVQIHTQTKLLLINNMILNTTSYYNNEELKVLLFKINLENKLNYGFNFILKGGGINSQKETLILLCYKLLVWLNKQLKSTFKKTKNLTTDSRIKESKKYGLKKARKASQFSKR